MKYLWGFFLVIIGFLMLLDNLNVVHFNFWQDIWNFWPFLIIVWGFSELSKGNKSWAILLLIIGILNLLINFDIVQLNFWTLIWPTLIIFIGVSLIIGKNTKKLNLENNFNTNSNDYLKIDLVFSGLKENIKSDDFQGGNIKCVFSGVELRLDTIKLTKDANLNIDCVLGGVKLIVPMDINIVTKGKPVIGGIENRIRNQKVNPEFPTLYINYKLVMSGIEISN